MPREDNAVEFEEFNTRIEAGKNGVSLLWFSCSNTGFHSPILKMR